MASWSACYSRRSRLIKPFVSEGLSLQRLTSRTLHPIAEQILALYTKEQSRGDYKIFPDTMSDWKLLRHLKAVGLACGIRTPLTWHCARHTFGTLTLEVGVPIESIAKMMGHSSIASTQIYAQVTDQKIARDMDKLIKRKTRL